MDAEAKRLVAKALVCAAAVLEAGLPRQVVAFNGGRAWVGDKPDISYVGSGESSSSGAHWGNILGPGIYFATEEDVAKRYMKFGGNRPTLHKVLINTKGLYETRSGKPLWLRNNMKTAYEELVSRDEFKAKLKYDRAGNPTGDVHGHDLGKHGQGLTGNIFALLGAVEGRKFLLKAGVTGVFEKLPVGYEIAVFDPRIVSLVEKVPFYSEDEALEKDKKDEVDNHQVSIDLYSYMPDSELDDWSRKDLADAVEFFKKNPSLLRR